MKIRPAVTADVPAVARLILAALADEAPWKSFFPPLAQSNTEFVEYSEAVLNSYLEPGKAHDWLFLVLELSEGDSGPHSAPLIVSAAVWDTSAAATPRGSSYMAAADAIDAIGNASNSLATATAKIPDKLAALGEATWSLEGLDKRLGGHGPCVYLHMLATSPSHQRRGYGRALATCGNKHARDRQMPLCVQVGPRGYILFSGLGFVDLGPVLLPAEKSHGSDELFLKVLLLDGRRRDSLIGSLIRFISH